MIASDDLASFRTGLGDDGVDEHRAVEVDGVPIHFTLRPGDVAELARTIAMLSERRLPAVVLGSGSRLGVGNPPRGAELFLSTSRLNGIDEFEPAEGVCRVRAGMSVRRLREEVNAEGWDVPLDPPSANATVGGTLAAATVGPRVQAFGPPRDAVLGLEVVLGNGERTRCGGRVVKNVAGYDMNKLYTGSFGTLGVIASAWLRLRPTPRRVRCFEAPSHAIADAFSATLGASRLTSARIAALVTEPGGEGGLRVLVELAGENAAVEQDSAWLTTEWGASEVPQQTVDEVGRLQTGLEGAGGLRFRLSALPSEQAALISELRSAGASTLSYPGLRLVYAGFPMPVDAPVADYAACFRSVEAATAATAGGVLCESAPAAAKVGRDVHGDVAAFLPIFEGLKRRFDPTGVLNPGRFAGGL